MKKFAIGIILTLVFGLGNLIAQTPIYYKYDKAGNRELRTIDFSKIQITKSVKDSTFRNKKYEDNQDDFSITIYPNPTQGELKIDISGDLSKLTTAIYLFDLKGKLLKTSSPLTSSNILDITDKPNGVYILKIRVGEKTSDWKIVKE